MTRKTSQCRVSTCDEPVVEGTFLCSTHILEKPRCEGFVRTYDDQGNITSERRCKKQARAGHAFCTSHGANSPKSDIAAQKARTLTVMEQFVQPYSGDFNPLDGYEQEWRRTMARIHWLEGRIADLEDEKALVWGQTKEENINATEFSGTNRTYEARIHVFEDMLRWERTQLLKLTQMWVKAGIEQQKIDLVRQYADIAFDKLKAALLALGFDPNTEEVQEVMYNVFMEGGPRGYLAIES